MTPFTARARSLLAVLATVALAIAATGAPAIAQDGDADGVEGRITLYTSVTQDTVDAVLAALAETTPDLEVDVFRAPTGELDARIATELRTGGIAADVLWLTDPLSAQRYEADGLLAPLEEGAFKAVPAAYRGDSFVGTRLLNLVLVAGADAEQVPTSWSDLVDPAFADGVAIPDPGFAGSAFAALGYLGTDEAFGMDYYQALKDNGAVQLRSPVDTLTGVAEGNYAVGVTLDKIARSNIEAGAPIQLVWPEPGAIALFSPAAVVAESDDPAAAAAFLTFLVTPEAQAAIAGTGWQPVRSDVEGPAGGAVVSPDWPELYGRQSELLEDYYAIFGD
jgi:iron(III) transport system substrate-binding protein